LGAGGQPEQIEAQNQVVADFNASHPNIELQIQIADNNVAYDTLATLIASEAVSPGQALVKPPTSWVLLVVMVLMGLLVTTWTFNPL